MLNTFQKAERNRFFAFCQNLRLPEVVCVVKLIRTIYLIINVFCYVECASFKFRNYIEMFIVACRRLFCSFQSKTDAKKSFKHLDLKIFTFEIFSVDLKNVRIQSYTLLIFDTDLSNAISCLFFVQIILLL